MIRRLAAVLGILALAVVTTVTPVAADHCGADSSVVPTVGPPGTEFVFSTNLGSPSRLQLFRNGRLIRTVPLPGSGDVSFGIATTAGDSGTWLARASVIGNAECRTEARFTVTLPDTSTATEPEPPSPEPAPLIVPVVAGLLAFGLAFRRFPGRR